MDIKILDSWLRDYLQTEAKPDEIARALSLTSASIEKVEKSGNDFIYHIEVTTNRPDIASVIGLAREAAAILPRFEIQAKFIPIKQIKTEISKQNAESIEIINDKSLVKRICCVIMEVKIGESPEFIKKRLEASGTRSLNNLIDITNYVMHEIGHPTHVFDYDRLTTKKLIIRESKKGEKITTLDKKTHILDGGDIVADNGKGEIVDLLGIMGTDNSVVTNTTKRILFFIDNNDSKRIRKTSMSLAIRTEAAGLNEKDIDPELAMPALIRGIEMYQKYAGAKIISKIIDIYPFKFDPRDIVVSKSKINKVVGISIPTEQSKEILISLGFEVKKNNDSLIVSVPSWRRKDIQLEEDVIEEIARVFGYHNLPSELPSFNVVTPYNLEKNVFFWEDRVKEAIKYWGFTETYTYSMVSADLFGHNLNDAISLENPLDLEHVYLRTTLIPSLLQVINENSAKTEVKIFEISNVYKKKVYGLPEEVRFFSGIWKNNNISFFNIKGLIEQIINDLGITNLDFKDTEKEIIGADIFLEKEYVGKIEILGNDLFAFEINFDLLTKHATLKKTYNPIPKFPPLIEDLALIVENDVKTGEIIEEIEKQSPLVVNVSLLDVFDNTKTFHIIYQDKNKNLNDKEVTKIREKILKSLFTKFSIKLKI